MSAPVTMPVEIAEIRRMLPHRYPFLLIDRVLEIEPGVRALALKNVTMNEPFFPGHFPHHPVMPGVLILEAMAQAAAQLSFKSSGERPDENSLVYFAGIDKARFKRPVEPGDQLIMTVKLRAVRRGIWMFTGEAMVDDKLAASADIMCTAKDF